MVYRKIFGFSKSESVTDYSCIVESVELQAHYCSGPCYCRPKAL